MLNRHLVNELCQFLSKNVSWGPSHFLSIITRILRLVLRLSLFCIFQSSSLLLKDATQSHSFNQNLPTNIFSNPHEYRHQRTTDHFVLFVCCSVAKSCLTLGDPNFLLKVFSHALNLSNKYNMYLRSAYFIPLCNISWIHELIDTLPYSKIKATHSSILAWKIPWTEEPSWLQRVSTSWTELSARARQWRHGLSPGL